MAARAHLCDHADVALRPVQQYHLSNPVQSATAEEHAQAFLEHDRHAAALVDLFLTYASASRQSESREFRVIVYPRFDGAVVDLMDAAITCGRAAHADLPHLLGVI